MMLKKLFFSFTLFCVLFLFFTCKKKESGYGIPYVRVNFFIYPSDPQFNNLNAVGGWTYVTGGSRGILIYRKSNEEFMAFERHCPYNPDNACGRIEVNTSNIIAVDSCCGSQFLMTDGSVIKGPSAIPLLTYQTTFNGTELHVFN